VSLRGLKDRHDKQKTDTWTKRLTRKLAEQGNGCDSHSCMWRRRRKIRKEREMLERRRARERNREKRKRIPKLGDAGEL
jgi:hypothetical protein